MGLWQRKYSIKMPVELPKILNHSSSVTTQDMSKMDIEMGISPTHMSLNQGQWVALETLHLNLEIDLDVAQTSWYATTYLMFTVYVVQAKRRPNTFGTWADDCQTQQVTSEDPINQWLQAESPDDETSPFWIGNQQFVTWIGALLLQALRKLLPHVAKGL